MMERKRLLWAALSGALLVIGFACGFASGTLKFFPHGLVREIYEQARARPSESHPPGRWIELRPTDEEDGLDEDQRRQIARLTALGYVQGAVEATSSAGTGVVRYDPRKTYPGLNLLTSGHAAEAELLDMDGRVVHSWRFPFENVWPDRVEPEIASDDFELGQDYWRRIYLLENGDLLAVFQGWGVIRLDKKSNLVWALDGVFHHDFDVRPDGTIYALRHAVRDAPQLSLRWPILDDQIVTVSSHGEVLSHVSLLDALENSPFAPLLHNRRGDNPDIFHANSIQILDGSLESRLPAFRKGNALISIRNLDLIAVVDLEAAVVVWALTGLWKHQHESILLENGNIILFDNEGFRRESTVIEINPLTQQIIWSYPQDGGADFFSNCCGTNQRLPNGNTLIAATLTGRAIEVTHENEIVWEFVNPHRAGEADELIAAVYDVRRVPERLDWLSRKARAASPE